MTVIPESIALPVHRDADGVLRVGGTRVTLDSVVGAFQEGFTAEEIAQQYPTVLLPDIYEVLGFYLRHQTELDEYLAERRHAGEQIRAEYEAEHDSAGIRARLLARRAATPQAGRS